MKVAIVLVGIIMVLLLLLVVLYAKSEARKVEEIIKNLDNSDAAMVDKADNLNEKADRIINKKNNLEVVTEDWYKNE